MSFANPGAVAIGAAAALLPVLIHWLTRPRPVVRPLSTVRFVVEAVQQRRSRRRLRDTLILAARTAAVLLLAAAVARPLFGVHGGSRAEPPGPTVRVVLLDVSQSMAARTGAFAAKCAGYLERGYGLVVLDAVTTRRADLHTDLLAALGVEAGPSAPADLSAVSYRAVGRGAGGRLLSWPAPLEVGQPLPTLPLWLAADLAVPLDLEASHTAACADLRIRPTGP
jgi:hypothetical protein